MLDYEQIKNYQDKIIIFYKQNRRMPTYSELQNLTHYRSKSGVSKLVHKLEDKGFLRRDRDGRLVPGYNFFSVPFPGTVQAGFPSPADDGFVETNKIDLYDFLVKDPQNCFVHQVTGDSMVDAGIFDGDLILSERCDDAAVGSIVIAEVNGSLTVKRLMKNNQGIRFLQAENSEHDDIYAEDDQDITILAMVRSVVRQLEVVKN